MSFRIASRRLRWGTIAASVACGLVLAGGFLPTTRSLADAVGAYFPGKWVSAVAFPGLAAFFFLTTPRPPSADKPWLSVEKALWTIPVPMAISFVFGFFHRTPSVFELARSSDGKEALLWFLICIPLGEEWLFRGWLQSIAERLVPNVRLTETNPLPIAVWASALGFSFWHLQNAVIEPLGFVAFQMMYTLLTGLWLGYLRWATGRVLPCVLGHFALNLASNLW